MLRPAVASPFRLLIGLAALLGVAAVGLGFLGRLHPAFDAFAHFRFHLGAVALAAGLALAAASKRRGPALLAMVAGASGVIGASGGPLSAALAPRAPSGGTTYTLLQANVLFNNAEPDRLLSVIRDIRPDIVTLDEVSAMWVEKLNTLADEYPFRLYCRRDSWAVAMLSRRPPRSLKDARCHEYGALAVAGFDLDGRDVEIGAVHLMWPWPYGQSGQVDRLSAHLGNLASDAIMAGDLNAAPWSWSARRLAMAGELTLVGGIGPTWMPIELPESLRFAGLPIDNVMTKGAIVIHSVQRLAPIGSDHLPVLVEFSLGKPNGER